MRHLNSLRGRYTLIALVLATAMLAGALLTYVGVNNARERATQDIETRKHLLEHSRHIREALWRSYKSLDAFLLDPNREQPREQIHRSIRGALDFVKELAAHPWIASHDLVPVTNDLKRSLHALDQAAEDLIRVRRDATQQYPSLAVGNEVMQPNRNNFNNSIALAINEGTRPGESDYDPEVSAAFIEVRHLWSQMLSNFRLYLANRVGSFNEEALPVQEEAIATMHRELMRELELLKLMDADDRLGFESSNALDELAQSAARWYSGFEEVKRLHASDAWRADALLVKNTIEPRLEQIWGLLLSIDVAIESSAEDDVRDITQAAQTQNRTFWILTAMGLGVLALGFVVMENAVFRPIAAVARALKAESFGQAAMLLPSYRLAETRSLVDAFSEMSKQVRERQMALEHQATHDALTGLANRVVLQDRLHQAVRLARRDTRAIALLLMDLDRFKEINDTLGHPVGDRLLKQVGMRLRAALRETDTVARLGGDEFAILVTDAGEDQATHIANKAIRMLERPFEFDGLKLYVKVSIGIAVCPDHGEEAQQLVRRADIAMYFAKQNKLGVTVYDTQQDQYSVGRLALVGDLRGALDAKAFELHYQPKIDLRSGSILGLEALLRWHHPNWGWIPPDQIVSLAEQTGLIQPLTYWVLDSALRQCARLRKLGLQVAVSVNLSPYNLQDPNLTEHVRSLLAGLGVCASALTLEITESTMMTNLTNALEVLSSFDAAGIQLAVDDFGTGFSSLAYLKQLPVGELKIDKSFVMDMIHDESDATIVKSTIDLAHNLGLRVVAEGIESQEAMDLLETLNCDEGQGYHISPPIPQRELEQWLAADHRVVNRLHRFHSQ